MRILLLTLALAAADVAAQPVDAAGVAGDPLQSAECRAALSSLQVNEAAAASLSPRGPAADDERHRAVRTRLEASRRKAAAACLRSRDDPPSAAGPDPPPTRPPPVQAPMETPRLLPPRPALPSASRQEPAAPLTRPAQRPRFITTCDAIGCWADDGSRLDRVGPDLRGPRGLCTLQGTLLTCP